MEIITIVDWEIIICAYNLLFVDYTILFCLVISVTKPNGPLI